MNPYRGQIRSSDSVISIMRRVNLLEQRVAGTTEEARYPLADYTRSIVGEYPEIGIPLPIDWAAFTAEYFLFLYGGIAHKPKSVFSSWVFVGLEDPDDSLEEITYALVERVIDGFESGPEWEGSAFLIPFFSLRVRLYRKGSLLKEISKSFGFTDGDVFEPLRPYYQRLVPLGVPEVPMPTKPFYSEVDSAYIMYFVIWKYSHNFFDLRNMFDTFRVNLSTGYIQQVSLDSNITLYGDYFHPTALHPYDAFFLPGGTSKAVIYNSNESIRFDGSDVLYSKTDPATLTEWDRFLRDQTRESIGLFPAPNALVSLNNPPEPTDPLVAPDTLTQIRDAIEALAPYFENPATSTPYTFAELYETAMGDRTAYGAQGGVRSTWTRTKSQMEGTPTFDIDIGELHECLRVLESSITA